MVIYLLPVAPGVNPTAVLNLGKVVDLNLEDSIELAGRGD